MRLASRAFLIASATYGFNPALAYDVKLTFIYGVIYEALSIAFRPCTNAILETIVSEDILK